MSVTDSSPEESQKASRQKGLVVINTGHGKGKTTAALGLLLRAWGHDMKVIMLQFVKKSTANFGEHRAARKIGIDIIPQGAGFTFGGKNEAENKRLSIEQWNRAKELIDSGTYQVVALDEFTYPLKYGWLPVTEVIDVLGKRPQNVHVVITGRDAPQELIDFADLVTEMKEIKHPLRKGIKAQKGIEF
ncbi:MAG: cob(I)yrinic acid a,c-diamide adenosyltransferase [Chloroflexi bacterium]|nr:cob(I)yrinic acid a,c-diamide adenosyltransferase [Chloroflexota bacterium]